MRTRTEPRPTCITRWALALCALAAVACDTPRTARRAMGLGAVQRTTRYSASYVFTITYANGCPDAVEVDPAQANCVPDGATAPLKDCARTRRGEHVVFRWDKAEKQGFKIQFAPFKHGALSSQNGAQAKDLARSEIDQTIDAPANPDKPYPFSIVPDDPAACTKTIDPQIIVD